MVTRKARRAGLTGRTNNIARSDLSTRNFRATHPAVVQPCEGGLAWLVRMPLSRMIGKRIESGARTAGTVVAERTT